MNIACTWSAADIKVGRFFYLNPNQKSVSEDPGYFLSTLHKIGYMPERGDSEDSRYVSIAMNDGQVISEGTKDDFAKSLTDNGYMPCEGVALSILLNRVAVVYGDK